MEVLSPRLFILLQNEPLVKSKKGGEVVTGHISFWSCADGAKSLGENLNTYHATKHRSYIRRRSSSKLQENKI